MIAGNNPGLLRRATFYGLIISIVALAVLLFALVSGALSRQTVLIDAKTRALEITFTGTTDTWTFPEAVYCVRVKYSASLERGQGPCDARAYREESGELQLNMHPGVTAVIAESSAEGVVLTVSGHRQFGADGVPSMVRILLNRDDWIALGTLSFVGQITLGYTAASGEDGVLIGGSYAFRERPLFSSRTEIIKSGDLRRGESVKVLQRIPTIGPASWTPAALWTWLRHHHDWVESTVYGSVSPDLSVPEQFLTGLAAAGARTQISLSYFGAAAPSAVRPNWVDRSLGSPLVLAIAPLLSLLLTLVQLSKPSTTARTRNRRLSARR